MTRAFTSIATEIRINPPGAFRMEVKRLSSWQWIPDLKDVLGGREVGQF